MKSRIVENWLTKVTELTFTIPFCQVLLSEGKRVVHISSQGPGEQGKDIIAVDSVGVVHCYQLKCGNINARVWAEIKSEIDQLVELPPRHPSLPNEVDDWVTYLVTNGSIANPTARDIYDYAEIKHKRGHQALRTITGKQLLASFAELYDEFLPVDAVNWQQFLELYNQHGDFELNLKKFKLFFESFFESHAGDSRTKKAEAVRASLVLCNYLLSNKHSQGNRLDVIKAYTLLQASIYHFVASQELVERFWRDTDNLLADAIEIEFRQLIDELVAHEHHYVQSEYGVLSEAVTHKIRCTELVGYLSAYRISCVSRGVEPHKADQLDQISSTLFDSRVLLGEVFVPLFADYVAILRLTGREAEAARVLVDLLTAIVECHRTEGGRGLPTPYYGISESVDWSLRRGVEIREDFRWRSFSIRSLILLAAKLDLREELDYYWPVLSRISQQEVIPARPQDYLLWRIEDGQQSDKFPEMTQSWAELVADASADYSGDLPPVLRGRKHYLPLFLNVMPHRFTHRLSLVALKVQ